MNKILSLFLVIIIVLFARASFSQVKFEEELKDLFKDVQMSDIFRDSKTFPDCTPLAPVIEIYSSYKKVKGQPGFDLRQFVYKYFQVPKSDVSEVYLSNDKPVKDHINELWPILTRQPSDAQGSILPLPYPYIVPGGRFREVYYWDSYFTMLGLKVAEKKELIRSMIRNFAYLIDTVGFIPNANRSYYLSRSQPPFFSLMVELLSSMEGDSVLVEFLPQLEKEHSFWMQGRELLTNETNAHRRVVLLKDGEILNRYWDDNPRPRPESFKEDSLLAKYSKREPEDLYRNIRSACESGWDFSSRWLKDGKSLESIITTHLIPVDLNCLLHNLERVLAKGYSLKKDPERSKKYNILAETRKKTILKYCWDSDKRFFFDYNFINRRRAESYSLAAAFPLFFKIATSNQAKDVERVVLEKFLKPGGLATTLVETKQQWDAPNGWPPLQLMMIKGLERYKLNQTAITIKERWVSNNIRVYKNTGKLMEKYNVLDNKLIAGGGEYPSQDGFGWTNGVLLELLSEMD